MQIEVVTLPSLLVVNTIAYNIFTAAMLLERYVSPYQFVENESLKQYSSTISAHNDMKIKIDQHVIITNCTDACDLLVSQQIKVNCTIWITSVIILSKNVIVTFCFSSVS